MTTIRLDLENKGQLKSKKDELDYFATLLSYRGDGAPRPLTRSKVEETILKSKFKQLQERLIVTGKQVSQSRCFPVTIQNPSYTKYTTKVFLIPIQQTAHFHTISEK